MASPGNLGTMFIGSVFATGLFGVGTVQTSIYFQTHRGTGKTFFKLVVLYLWTLDALHLAFIIHFIYYYLVTNYGNREALAEVVWSFKLQLLFAIFIVWCIHLLYAYRIWIVSRGRSRVLPTIMGIIVILDLGVAIETSWEIYKCHVFTDFIGIMWSILLCSSMVAFTEVVIASMLCYLFATSRTGFSSTDSFLSKLIVYTIHTGCLTSACSIAICITLAIMHTNLIYMALKFVVAKLSFNSCMALMNAQYYQQPNANTGIMESESGKLQASRANVLKHSHDEELHSTPATDAVMLRQPIALKKEKFFVIV